MVLNNQWITEEIKQEIKKKSKDKWKQTNKNHDPKPMGCSKSVSERGGFSYFRKQEQFKVNYLTSHLNQLEK